jgi:hypothetical protein
MERKRKSERQLRKSFLHVTHHQKASLRNYSKDKIENRSPKTSKKPHKSCNQRKNRLLGQQNTFLLLHKGWSRNPKSGSRKIIEEVNVMFLFHLQLFPTSPSVQIAVPLTDIKQIPLPKELSNVLINPRPQ